MLVSFDTVVSRGNQKEEIITQFFEDISVHVEKPVTFIFI